MITRGVVGLLAALLLSPGSPPERPHVLFRFADPSITEASGIAAGIDSPGVFYVQNDSGDSSRLFAVDARTGATAATIVVGGARNVDWEDIAVADDRQSEPSIWLADIGDNDAVRRTVQLYQVAEPRIDESARGRTIRVHVTHEWQLRYPGGPVDAESLAVGPDGRAYIVTKSVGAATVYRVPLWRPGGAVQVLRPVGHITLHPTGTANPFGVAGQLVATGAAISTTGIVFAIRTYSDVWAWRIRGSITATLRRSPVVVPLPRQPQGEGLALLARHAVVDSERTGSSVYEVPLPRTLTHLPASTHPPAVVGTPAPRPSPSVGPDSDAAAGNGRWWWWAGGAALVAAGTALMALAARRRR